MTVLSIHPWHVRPYEWFSISGRVVARLARRKGSAPLPRAEAEDKSRGVSQEKAAGT